MFGNELGEQVKDVKRALERAVLKAHGYRPRYVVKIIGQGDDARPQHTAQLTIVSQAARQAIDLLSRSATGSGLAVA